MAQKKLHAQVVGRDPLSTQTCRTHPTALAAAPSVMATTRMVNVLLATSLASRAALLRSADCASPDLKYSRVVYVDVIQTTS